mmetsp:Transcript_38857/g.115590  ORF Transcript_38857/g.115590 Transcript_38857/m.115590 type:complete len:200 (+) Transcript_38857:2269-2868(+)
MKGMPVLSAANTEGVKQRLGTVMKRSPQHPSSMAFPKTVSATGAANVHTLDMLKVNKGFISCTELYYEFSPYLNQSDSCLGTKCTRVCNVAHGVHSHDAHRCAALAADIPRGVRHSADGPGACHVQCLISEVHASPLNFHNSKKHLMHQRRPASGRHRSTDTRRSGERAGLSLRARRPHGDACSLLPLALVLRRDRARS